MAKPFIKLRAKMLGMDINQKDLAESIGISASVMSLKLTCRSPFLMSEMYAICDKLDIRDSEIAEYFPRKEVQNMIGRNISKF